MIHSTRNHVRLHVRVGMDVWDAYQEHYIGSVIRVWHGPQPMPAGAREVEKEDSVESHPLVHEEGHVSNHAGGQGERRNGESMGPFPTGSAGNGGPTSQSAASDYATNQTDERTDVIFFAVRPGRLNLGILTRPLYIPSSAVHSISMERVVLGLRGDSIPREWRTRRGQ